MVVKQKLEKQEELSEDSELSLEKPKKKRKDRRVEREYTDFIEVTDPVTGHTIKQKVKVTRYKSKGEGFKKSRPAIEEEEFSIGVDDE